MAVIMTADDALTEAGTHSPGLTDKNLSLVFFFFFLNGVRKKKNLYNLLVSRLSRSRRSEKIKEKKEEPVRQIQQMLPTRHSDSVRLGSFPTSRKVCIG